MSGSLAELSADVVVAGGGLGGLAAAEAAAAGGARVLHLTGSPGASNWISSINAALGTGPSDQPADLATDMLRAGHAINARPVVDRIAERVGPEVERLAAQGVSFVLDDDGRFARRKAAGSSAARAVYTAGMAGVDAMAAIQHRLATEFAGRVVSIPSAIALELVVREGRIAGCLAYGTRSRDWMSITAPAVVLATGGLGGLYATSTNPPGSRGIGYAMAAEAGAVLADMEFVSFEPLVMLSPARMRGHSLPTTVLSEGAVIRDRSGRAIFDPEAIPTKDVLCRTIVREVRDGNGTPAGGVVLDLRAVAESTIARYSKLTHGIEAAGSLELEVLPAQHYLMGGIRIDGSAATSVPGLFAVGEASNGAHGAHRLAGSGGAEVIAMGPVAGRVAAEFARQHPSGDTGLRLDPRPDLVPFGLPDDARATLEKAGRILDRACAIERDEPTLRAAASDLAVLGDRVLGAGGHVGRVLALSSVIIESARQRAESRGDHYRIDHPERDDAAWHGNVFIKRGEDGVLVPEFRPIVDEEITR